MNVLWYGWRCCNLGQDHSRASFHRPPHGENHTFCLPERLNLTINRLPQTLPSLMNYSRLSAAPSWELQKRKPRLEWLSVSPCSAHSRGENISQGPLGSTQEFIFPSKYITSGGKTPTNIWNYIRKDPWTSEVRPTGWTSSVLCSSPNTHTLQLHCSRIPSPSPPSPFSLSSYAADHSCVPAQHLQLWCSLCLHIPQLFPLYAHPQHLGYVPKLCSQFFCKLKAPKNVKMKKNNFSPPWEHLKKQDVSCACIQLRDKRFQAPASSDMGSKSSSTSATVCTSDVMS